MLSRQTENGPLDPPYPRPWEIKGWRSLGALAWLAGVALWLLHHPWLALVLLAPGLMWTAATFGRIRSLRRRALDGLDARASGMLSRERERNIDEIVALYGGKLNPATQRRLEEIRRLPEPNRPPS